MLGVNIINIFDEDGMFGVINKVEELLKEIFNSISLE